MSVPFREMRSQFLVAFAPRRPRYGGKAGLLASCASREAGRTEARTEEAPTLHAARVTLLTEKQGQSSAKSSAKTRWSPSIRPRSQCSTEDASGGI